MLVRVIEIGTKMFLIEKKDDQEGGVRLRLRSKLIDRENDSVLLVDYPINEQTEKQSLLFDGTEWIASFIGRDGAMYTFSTEIIGRIRTNIPMLRLRDPGKEKYIRIQRRDYVRVKTAIHGELFSVDGDADPFKTIILDISGGGCKLVIPPGITISSEEEWKLQFELPLQSEKRIQIETTCAAVRLYEATDDGKRQASFKFLDLEERKRQGIVQYCFERQLKLRQMDIEGKDA